MTKTEKLRERIIGLLGQPEHISCQCEVCQRIPKLTDQILAFCKEAGLGFVDEEARLPINPYNSREWPSGRAWWQAQQAMLKAGYRKTEPIEV